MCDQTEVSYLEDDVVWVKIGPIWWPGVVKDLGKDEEGKEILASLKRKPIAVVKFFKEDNYEFVKNLDHIYHYNCRRKDEFIKKGLDKFRNGASHMKKFPADVTTAESLTNGDVNIINDPKFYPEKKESYSEIFGSGKKKIKKDSELSPKARGRSSPNVTPYRPITHQRFINKVLRGESDHKVKTLIQSNSGSEDGVSRNPYRCHICKFETSRVNVIVAHHRLSHSTKNSVNWTGSDSKLIRRKPVYKSRKIKCKKLFDTTKDNDYESEEEEFERKKSPKSKTTREKVKSLEKNTSEVSLSSPPKRKSKEDLSNVSDPKKKRFTDVLLADWDEDEEDDKRNTASEEKKENDEEGLEKKDENISESVEQSEKPASPKARKSQNEKMSCFDFDEEEEGFIGMSNANTYGRKIPRVIPVKDKTELGMDLEIEELFKRKSESESEIFQDSSEQQTVDSEDSNKTSEVDLYETRGTEHSTTGEINNSIPREVESSTPVDDSTLKEAESSTPKEVENFPPRELDNSPPREVESSISKEVESTTPVENSTSKEVEGTTPVENSTPREVENSIPREVEISIPREVENSIPREVEISIPREVENSISREVENSFPREVENSPTREAENSALREVENSPPREAENSALREAENSPVREAENSPPREAESPLPREGESPLPREAESPLPREGESPLPREAENSISREVDEISIPAKGPGRRKRSKASKEEDAQTISEESVALRRARRPGAKKSYLNEVIEKVADEEDTKSENENKKAEKVEPEEKIETKPTKEEPGSSSRRKQDFKHHTLDSEREEIVYSEIVSNEQKTKSEPEKKKGKTQNKDRRGHSEDLTLQIDSLLEETKPSSLAEISESLNEIVDKSEELKSNNFSFDFVPSEQICKKSAKSSKEMKSISRMFSDSFPSSESNTELNEESQSEFLATDSKDALEEKISTDSQMRTLKFSSTNANTSQKRGSIVLSSTPAASEAALAKVKVLPVMRQGNGAKDCIVLPTGKKLKSEEESDPSSESEASRPKNIKAIKVKSDSLPSSLISSGKLKGQTIIHQKGGKYVIVTQSPPLGRHKSSSGKVQSGSKVVILTNQLGEQKIITASGLQQTKFKVDGQKIVADSVTDKETAPSTSNTTVGQTQPIIKMVPDGKGGIMKQLTVSPKKVLLGGTKVLVSCSGSTFSTGNSVQKITLSGGVGVTRSTGGDFRLIENYKGSGKTVLIQGSSNAGSSVVLKSASGVPRQVTKVIQNSQNFPALKKKPKILMRASTSQGEFVMQPSESPTFVVKQKGTDGKFSAQKFVRTEIVNQPKSSLSGTGTKAFFISGQSANKKGESYIITTNESVPGKVIRMRQKIKEVDVSSSKAQKVSSKNSDIYAISQNNLILPSDAPSETEDSQIVQMQEQSQQPVLQTQVIAMPGPVGADGNQTYVLVSVDENGVVQGVDNSVVAYDATAQPDSLIMNPTSTNNVILINPQANEEVAPVFSTSSQDILAEALANTNVLEGSINNEMESVVPSILLPPSIPSSVVQETSITLQKPIMTPLEMPSSVTPDTSGLEPPPLPPTPTEEDVLMEETEMSAEVMQEHQEKERENSHTDTMQTYLESENYDPEKSSEPTFQLTDFPKDEGDQKIFEGVEEDKKMTEFYHSESLDENTTEQEEQKGHAQEEYLLENSQEQSHSFQSLPVLNDEPDTSEDVQGAEMIPEQPFEIEKPRTESGELSQLLREQEPPSSTNNEITETDQELKFEGSKYENYHEPDDSGNGENESKNKEPEIKADEELCEGPKEKETLGIKESQSLPVIADESNVNSYEMDSIYSDVMSQKRFQEETEVSSTTDEFSNKDVTN